MLSLRVDSFILREVCVPYIVVGTPKNQEGVIGVVITTNDVKLSQLRLYFQYCLSLVLTSDASIKKKIYAVALTCH